MKELFRARSAKGTLFAALLFAHVLSGILQSLGALSLNTNLQAGDQGAYLHLSLAQAEGRALTDGNRHPLFPAILVPMAERDPDFFARARWVSFFVASIFLLGAVGYEAYRRKNPTSAFFLAAFLSTHVQMRRTGSEIWCEPLLFALTYWLWTRLDAGKKGGVFHGVNGVLTGLLYLTKGTGLQITFLFWGVTLLFSKPRKSVLAGIIVFLVVASPLFVWNWKTYGNPVYSFASTHNMWFDEADEIWYDDPEQLPTLGSYLETHSASEMLSRVGRGVLLESAMTVQLLWSDWRLPEAFTPAWIDSGWTVFKAVFCLLVCLGLFSLSKGGGGIVSREGLLYFGLLWMVFFLSFGWYAQLTNAPRFLMTVVPIAFLLLARLASEGVRLLTSSLPSSPVAWKALTVVAGIYAVISLGVSAGFAWKTAGLEKPSMGSLAEKTIESIEQLPEDSTVAFGPSHGLPLWMTRGDLTWRPIPWRIGWDAFLKTLEREGIRFVMVDGETLARRPYLQDLSRPDAESRVGWKVVFRKRDARNFFILFDTGKGGETP